MNWYPVDDRKDDDQGGGAALPSQTAPPPSRPLVPPQAETTERQDARSGSRREDRAPEKPTDLETSSWSGVLKRTIREFKEDELVDRAAALTYYGVLSIFPAILALVSVLGLVGTSATQPLKDNLAKVAPGPAREIFTTAIDNLEKSQGAGGVLFVIGLAAALWSASGYVAAFMRASNAIYESKRVARSGRRPPFDWA